MNRDYFDPRRNALAFVGTMIYLSLWFPVNDVAPQSTAWSLVSMLTFLWWYSFWMGMADGLQKNNSTR